LPAILECPVPWKRVIELDEDIWLKKNSQRWTSSA
jgi:hypothetical protein